jgi:hypothetical protein
MLKCWSDAPEDRCDFGDLVRDFERLCEHDEKSGSLRKGTVSGSVHIECHDGADNSYQTIDESSSGGAGGAGGSSAYVTPEEAAAAGGGKKMYVQVDQPDGGQHRQPKPSLYEYMPASDMAAAIAAADDGGYIETGSTLSEASASPSADEDGYVAAVLLPQPEVGSRTEMMMQQQNNADSTGFDFDAP